MDVTHTNAIHFVAVLSSTADMPGKLLTGVHGPEKVTRIIISNHKSRLFYLFGIKERVIKVFRQNWYTDCFFQDR